MNQDFAYFEQGIARIAERLPGMPHKRIVLNRLFFFLLKELDDIYNRHLEAWGLNTASFLALAMLMGSEDNRLNPSDLSDALVASRTNVTRLTDELVAAGWLARTPCVEDRRRVDLSLTDAGRTLFLATLPRMWQLVERQWADFSAAELVTFDRLLRKMQRGLDRLGEEA